ncbi:MAG: AraC family transcriptional regulator [Arcobacter sp.]|nr:MAG: AraC family transcriptional regulator [Arcobacter sp.]
MNKVFTKTFINEDLPFIELRYSNSNKHYKRHFHSTFSLGVNKEGVSIYTNNDKSYTLDKNMLSIMNPNAVHSCNSCTEILNKYYMMYLDPSWCMNIQKLVNSEIDSFVPVPSDLLEDESVYNKYISLCEYLFLDYTYEEKENELINFFMEFFALFLQEDKEILVDEKFKEIVTFLEENYKENISLEDLSLKFDLNSFYIIRLFKNQMNMTPHSYLLNLKINKSKELLKKGYSIVDTALECGFFDQSHFHRNFLKIVATTPKEYRLNFVQ